MKLRNITNWFILGALVAAPINNASADDKADILIEVLVRKGILSEQEASEISTEVDAAVAASEERIISTAVSQAISEATTSGVSMPSSLSGLKLYGDVRFRYQYENSQKYTGTNNDRSRWRYRARFGADYKFKESNFSLGTRFETSPANDSTNTNLGGFFDKTGDSLYIGLAYLSYEGDRWDIDLGKHKHPFVISKAFWDGDINPEGISESYKAGDWTFNFGQYIIDEEREDKGDFIEDDFLFVAQAEWNNGEGLTVAPLFMTTTSDDSTNTESALFVGENAKGYFNNFGVFMLPVEYAFESGGRKQALFGTAGINLYADDLLEDPNSPYYAGGADVGSQDLFFELGYKNGSAKKTGEWEWGARYIYVEGAAYSTNLSDSDFGKNHTNQHGIVAHGRYAFTDFFTGTVTLMQSDQIDSDYVSSVADAGEVTVLQVDASVKF